jgi:hypothetical protein
LSFKVSGKKKAAMGLLLKEALNKSSLGALLVKSGDHKAREKGRSRNYDARKRRAMAPQIGGPRNLRSGGLAAPGSQTAP